MSENRIGKDRIFVGGSIVVKALPRTVKNLFDYAMDHHVHFVIGDAPGVDTLVQSYLRAACYPHVTIYAMRFARNNVGAWPVKTHRAPPGVTEVHGMPSRTVRWPTTRRAASWYGTG